MPGRFRSGDWMFSSFLLVFTRHFSPRSRWNFSVDINQAPDWYQRGISAALLAPTAINQQKFKFSLYEGNKVSVKAGIGFYSKVDLGIVKYHFEQAAGIENFNWK